MRVVLSFIHTDSICQIHKAVRLVRGRMVRQAKRRAPRKVSRHPTQRTHQLTCAPDPTATMATNPTDTSSATETPEPDPSTSKKRPSSAGGRTSTTKKRQVTGTAKPPSETVLQYHTAKYPLYDPRTKKVGQHNYAAHTSFKQYDDHTLYVIPTIDAKIVPTRGVRLDDHTVALVIEKSTKSALSKNWRAEFDHVGMTRGLRVPLGHAAKVYKNVGDMDLEGNVLEEGEEGWYYLWHKGLHLLCGKEGLDGGIYKKRPSFEVPVCDGLGWKKSARAIVQYPAGHHMDGTMKDVEGYEAVMRAAGKWGGLLAGKKADTKAGGSKVLKVLIRVKKDAEGEGAEAEGTDEADSPVRTRSGRQNARGGRRGGKKA